MVPDVGDAMAIVIASCTMLAAVATAWITHRITEASQPQLSPGAQAIRDMPIEAYARLRNTILQSLVTQASAVTGMPYLSTPRTPPTLEEAQRLAEDRQVKGIHPWWEPLADHVLSTIKSDDAAQSEGGVPPS